MKLVELEEAFHLRRILMARVANKLIAEGRVRRDEGTRLYLVDNGIILSGVDNGVQRESHRFTSLRMRGVALTSDRTASFFRAGFPARQSAKEDST